ncbi:MAG: flagellar basal body rod protein FlgB [Spirochaetota bacterium]
MFEYSKMMQTNYLLEKALDVESFRRKVIANNIANVDVPHFKRSEVNFESELKRAIAHNMDPMQHVKAFKTDSRHYDFFEFKDITSVCPRVNLDYTTTYRNDGNNVDVEKEMVDAAKNQMRYNAYVTSLNENYKMLKMVMRTV